MTPSSVAAACSSKLNPWQNFLRRARPQARLMRLPNGACSTSCMPPDSSKKRSRISVSVVGRSEEHTSELQSQSNLVCRLLLEKKKKKKTHMIVVKQLIQFNLSTTNLYTTSHYSYPILVTIMFLSHVTTQHCQALRLYATTSLR